MQERRGSEVRKYFKLSDAVSSVSHPKEKIFSKEIDGNGKRIFIVCDKVGQ